MGFHRLRVACYKHSTFMKTPDHASLQIPFDLIVLGGGSGGYAAARTAAGLGLRTAVVDGSEELGGLCILRGCMPSKTFIESANRYLTIRHAATFGLRAENIGFDPAFIQQRKQQLIQEFADHRRDQLLSGPFTLIRGHGRMHDPHRVEVTSGPHAGTLLETQSIIVATGSVITPPVFPGLVDYLTSDDILASADIPASLIVLGAGPIALEFAHYHAAMGTRVEVLLRRDEILRGVDPQLGHALRIAMEHHGIRFHRTASNWEFTKKPDGTWVAEFDQHLNGHPTRGRVEGAKILAALGRRPATATLALDTCGVQMDSARIITAPSQQTTAPHIFAAGDVTGPHEIVHIAIQQGEIAARNAARFLGRLEGAMEEISYRNLVFGVFTWPQLATAGISDTAAREAGLDPVSADYPFAEHGKSMVMAETDGLVKLTADRKTGRILSGGVVGPEGVELIHEVAMAIQLGATVSQFAQTPHYHPTLSEIWTYPAETLAEICGTND